MFGHKSYKPSVDKSSSIAEYFLNFQKENEKDFSIFFQDQNIDMFNLYIVSIQYFSTIISILISANTDSNPLSVHGIKRKGRYSSQKEANLWGGVNLYDDAMTEASRNYPNEKIDTAVKLCGQFMGEYQKIMNEPIVNAEKCKKLGFILFKICGANLDRNPIARGEVEKRIDSLIYFVANYID